MKALMNVSMTSYSPSRAQISLLARQLWEEAGRPSGRDLEFWLRAETELMVIAQDKTPKATVPIKAGNLKRAARKQSE
jgi:hypothetical protein